MSKSALKKEELRKYVLSLKKLISEEIYFLYGQTESSVEIIYSWFQLNARCSDCAWVALDRFSLERIWWMMQAGEKIE